MTAYHFVLLRYVHNASAGEFANIGVVMWLPESRALHWKIHDRYARLSSFFQGFDGASYRQMTKALDRRMHALRDSLVEGNLFAAPAQGIDQIASTLVSEDATCFGWSEPMGGIADSPEHRLEQLLSEFVTANDASGPRERRDETEIYAAIERVLEHRGLTSRVAYGVEISAPSYAYRFKTAWMNGTRQVMEPISFDYLNGTEVVEKANTWSGRLLNLSKGERFQMTGVVAMPSRRDLTPAFEQAVRILREAPNVRTVIREDDLESFADEIVRDLESH